MLRDAVSIRLITLHSGRNVISTETYHITYGLSGCDQANGHSIAKHAVSIRSLSSTHERLLPFYRQLRKL